ncbi:HK97 family phage prohead protease [Nocardia sp. IBHARD005]|uniref:HK97 family phage prohead protease n=1 Tax=Nocardia sp. IBHARD005 TaxID=3457765 RepID=UPI004059F8CE
MTISSRRAKLIDVPEHRSLPAGDFEIRKTGDSLRLSGYASVFDAPYDVYGGAPMGWSETIARQAFDVTLSEKPDLHLLINHEGMPLARTKSGTLQLSTDKKGLLVGADLDRTDPDVQRLEAKMARGDMDEMSFAFRVKAQSWNEDETERTITEVSLHKGDVSVVNFGANPATSAQLRSFVDGLRGLSADDAMAEARSIGRDELARAHQLLGGLLRTVEDRPSGSVGRLAALRALGNGTELPD